MLINRDPAGALNAHASRRIPILDGAAGGMV
jgi:hypothetical protein